MKITLIIACLISPLWADDPCSDKAHNSVPGQYVEQLFTSLNLTSGQALAVLDLQSAFYPEFAANLDRMQTLRIGFLEQLSASLADNTLSDTEKAQLKSTRESILRGLINQKNLITARADAIKDLLTDSQLETLSLFEANISVPETSIQAGEVLGESLCRVLENYIVTGDVDPNLMRLFLDEFNNFMNTIYLPDWLEGRYKEVWSTFEGDLLSQIVSQKLDRTKAIRFLVFIKSGVFTNILQNPDFFNLVQNLPVYHLFVHDFMVDAALLSPISHCRLDH